jgi:hypothetical protein
MLDTVDAPVTDRTPRDLDRCQEVSVCDLNGAERFVVWAIRWRCSDQDDEEFADACLQDSFDRAGLPAAKEALEQFVCAACPHRLACSALQRLGCWRLNQLEARALHAIACLQAGLIGEAWHTLRVVCPEAKLKVALESLQDMAAALERSGGVIHRWKHESLGATSVAMH